jgi:hypothetical protein
MIAVFSLCSHVEEGGKEEERKREREKREGEVGAKENSVSYKDIYPYDFV